VKYPNLIMERVIALGITIELKSHARY